MLTGHGGGARETESRGPHRAGFSRISVPGEGRRGGFRAGVWYPTAAREGAFSEEGWLFRAARDALIRPGRRPVVLVSHDSGGTLAAHHDTCEHLACNGFVAVAPTHPGDNADDLSGYLGVPQLLGRARHLARALAAVLGTAKYAGIADGSRIGVLGHGAGGYGAVVWAGARPDFARFADHHRTWPEDPMLLPHWELAVRDLPERTVPPGDPRIGALLLWSPTFGYLFDRQGLAPVRAPAVIVRAGRDDGAPDRHHAAPYRDGLPDLRGDRVLGGVGPEVFAAPATGAHAAGGIGGVDPRAVHTALNAEALELFRLALGVPEEA